MINVVKVNVSRLATQWQILQWFSVTVMFFALHLVAICIVDVARYVAVPGQRAELEDAAVALPFMLPMILYVFYATWSSLSMMSRKHLKRLRRMYRILSVIYSVILILGSFFVVAVIVLRVAGDRSMEEAMGTSTIRLIVISALYGGTVVFVVIFSLVCLKSVKILMGDGRPVGELSLKGLHDFVERNQSLVPSGAHWMVRLDRPRGLLLIAAGGILFLAGAGIYDFMQSQAISHIAGHSSHGNSGGSPVPGSFMEVFGAICIFKGRSYLLPAAEAILAVDRRAPILYLRSFVDDKASLSEMTGGGMQFVDQSLEMKLSTYFSAFGPFVAIGSKDKAPKLGALRLQRSDGEWQGEVISLMANSRAIVASVGTTPWIKWELAEIVGRAYMNKTVFLFQVNQTGFRFARKRWERQEQRIQVLKECLHTQVGSHEFDLKKREFILAYVMRQSRRIIVTCKNPSSNMQFFGVVVGHYLLMGADQEANA